MRFTLIPIISSINVLLVIVGSYFIYFPPLRVTTLQKLERQCKSLEEAERLALEDFGQGKYRLIFDGLPEFSDRRILLDSILRAEYNIESLYSGCVGSTDEVNHYMAVMGDQLVGKYGKDFFAEARRKQRTIWEKKRAARN